MENNSQETINQLENKTTNNNQFFAVNLVCTIAIIIISIAVTKTTINYYYTHDSHNTVSQSVYFDTNIKKFTFASLTFDVPSNIIIEKDSDYTVIGKRDGEFFTMRDDKEEYLIRVNIYKEDFNYILENYNKQRGTTKNYDGKDYIVSEYGKRLKKSLVSVTKASEEKILIVEIRNKKNTYDYDLLKKYTEIINTVSEE